MLNTVFIGQPTDRPPLLIVHGLFGSARNWGVISKRLSDQRLVAAVDMRNHGESPRFPTQSYPDMAGDLAEVLEPLVADHGPCHVMGHSMGGKAAMVLALTRPQLLKSLIVADISPVSYSHDNTPLIHAMRGLNLSKVEKRSDADRQLAREVLDAGVRAFLLQSLVVKEKRWLLNLDVLEAEMPKIVAFPEVSGTFGGPAFFLSGGESTYVERDHRDRAKALFPKAKFASIPGAGHWLHAEKPREFEAACRTWMETVEAAR
ncbi:alpha/beta fold hydrolase [Celeribacter indicus]|uniref:Alpha/beta hydrolase n=1 Tax=Celeribacter indicus TaxID=1208324 RepID=A0A0B5DXY4_9RHOB|nr:alpha/beta fold hydrolase [Celeribacter indicus]AJE45591.1 alpha/beta hydrolase [Celeribacter indicus]SDW85140.1 Pimeloyl-ACP methyl ester carboxylesterase [Celeribacter indicus]